MAQVIKTIQVGWNWEGDTSSIKRFNIALTPQGSDPTLGSIISGQVDGNVFLYIFNNIILNAGVEYTAWVQAVYAGKDSDWVSSGNLTVADDGISTISNTKYYYQENAPDINSTPPPKYGDIWARLSDKQTFTHNGDEWIDGKSGHSVVLIPDAQAFTFIDNVANPTSQTISFTATKHGVVGTVVFTTIPTVTLTGTGDTRSLSLANFGTNNQVTIIATVGDTSDSITITKINQTTASAGADSTRISLEDHLTLATGGITLATGGMITNSSPNGISRFDSEGITFAAPSHIVNEVELGGQVYNYIGRTAQSGPAGVNSGDYISLIPPFKSTPKIVLIPRTVVSYKASVPGIPYSDSDQFFNVFASEVTSSGFRVNTQLVGISGNVSSSTLNTAMVTGGSYTYTTPIETTYITIILTYKGPHSLTGGVDYKEFIPEHGDLNSTKFRCSVGAYKNARTIQIKYKDVGAADIPENWFDWLLPTSIQGPTVDTQQSISYMKSGLPPSSYNVKITFISEAAVNPIRSSSDVYVSPVNLGSCTDAYSLSSPMYFWQDTVYDSGTRDGLARINENSYFVDNSDSNNGWMLVGDAWIERGTLQWSYRISNAWVHYSGISSSIVWGAPTDAAVTSFYNSVFPKTFEFTQAISAGYSVIDSDGVVDYIAYDGG
jgi:hypothetical protein